MKEEYWDIYDRDRNKTGRLHRRGEPMGPGEYHLIVHICIFNEKNELLIQRRVGTKRMWPDFWEVSASGCAKAGEDSRMAAAREVSEELGVPMDLSEEIPKFSFSFSRGFDDWWMVDREIPIGTVHRQEEEVSAVRYADREEVCRLAREGRFIPYHFIEQLFDMRDSHGAY